MLLLNQLPQRPRRILAAGDHRGTRFSGFCLFVSTLLSYSLRFDGPTIPTYEQPL